MKNSSDSAPTATWSSVSTAPNPVVQNGPVLFSWGPT